MSDPDVHTQPSISKLMGGIINDVQSLVRQQMTMFRMEIKEDLQKVSAASTQIAVALGIGLTGAVALMFTAVYGLAAIYPSLPMWACFGIVGVAVLAAGGILLQMALKRLKSVRSLSDQSVRAMKENVQWLTSSR